MTGSPMDPYMFHAARLFWVSLDSEAGHERPKRRRLRFGRRHRLETPAPEPSQSDAGLWPGLWRLSPVGEDELIAFGRDLEATPDVIGLLLAER